MKRTAFILISLCICTVNVGAGFSPPSAHAAPGFSPAQQAQPKPPAVVVFWEEGFPSADTATPTRAGLSAAMPDAGFVVSEQLADTLARAETRLLVLPFGSAFPEDQWPAIFGFLERGGNLLVLGGKSFTRPAYRAEKTWKLRASTLAFAQKLFINDHQTTPGSRGLQFQKNDDAPQFNVPAFEWQRAFSMTIRLSDEQLYPREGSAGSIDAKLTPLAWGASGGRRLSAPLVQIDHFQNNFVGGRWIFLACEPAPGFFGGAGRELLALLSRQALGGAEDFSLRPAWPLFLPGEPLTLQIRWQRFGAQPASARLELEVSAETAAVQTQSFPLAPGQFPYATQVTLPAASRKGLHIVTAKLYEGETLRGFYRTGFWVRDENFLRSGPRVTVNENFFEVDGRTQAILGTTYMASDVQRQFFLQPNPYVWDRDLDELRRAGFNMLRTGWWSAWDQIIKDGAVHEEMLRALEAFLMTARKHNLPVQFTFFAFLPEVLGGSNAYLDPESLRRQRELVTTVVERFKDVPWLSWDLINEPSFANPNQTWMTRPNRDRFELAAWNEWLRAHYSSRGALAEAWQTVLPPEPEPVPLPTNEEFATSVVYRTLRGGSNALKVHDYFLFAQEKFRDWAAQLRDAIRATGSKQLVTIGQDEGGPRDRLSPAFFADAVDFTTNHTWWLLDDLLWDSLTAKQPGKPLLIQETGIPRQVQFDGTLRRTAEQDAQLLERKLGVALGTSAGAIHWLWHINAYMRDDNEAAIGAIRADGTEKPEAEVLRKFAKFAAEAGAALSRPEDAPVVIVTSQAFQYSALNWLALEAQTKSVRALHNYCRMPGAVLAENQIAKLGHPRLVILPSPHALSEETWQALLKYVDAGGNLLISGSFERDANWRVTQRLAAFNLEAAPQPLITRQVELDLGAEKLPLSFAHEKQQFLDTLAFADGKIFHEIPRGAGKIFLASFPVELAEGLDAAATLYSWALRRAGLEAPFTGTLPSPGVLIRPVFMQNSILYLLMSESMRDEDVAIKDKLSGAEIRLRLPPRRATLVLLDKRTGKTIVQYPL